MSAEAVAALVQRFLIDETAEFGPYEAVVPDASPEVTPVVEGRLYRTQLLATRGKYRNRDVDVQVFIGLEELGGLLWEQDVRALLRIAASEQSALPRLLDGGYITAERTNQVALVGGMAFVATLGGRRALTRSDVIRFGQRPLAAFTEFRSLTRALTELHFIGVTHRNISRAAIDLPEGESHGAVLARFELSTLTTDLFRATVDSASSARDVVALLAADSDWHYMPPERLGYMLGGELDLVDEPGSDVFALGAVCAEWFVGPYDEIAELEQLAPDPTAPPEEVVRGQRRYSQGLQKRLRDDQSVPAALAEILAQMVSPDVDSRPSAHRVLGDLAEAFDRIHAAFSGPEEGKPHLMVYMAEESTRTIYHWGLIDHRPDTQAGRDALEALIRDDMFGSYLTDCPQGAGAFISGGATDALRSARTVVKGKTLAWFCTYFRPRDESGGLAPPTDKALIIRFVARLDIAAISRKLESLDWTSARRMPDLMLHELNTSRMRMQYMLNRAPSWRSRIEAVRTPHEASGAELDYRDAIEWLLEYQDMELASRSYPVIPTADDHGSDVIVRYDAPADARRVLSSPMFVKFDASPALRPEFGSFFATLENDDGTAEVDVLEDFHGRPGRGYLHTAVVVGAEGRDRVRLRFRSGRPNLPERFWLRPSDDRGTQIGLDRQRTAALELYGAVQLQDQLRTPTAIRTFENRWLRAGAELAGEAPAVVRDMLVCEPFAAVQGPPGTGKTTVAAAAIRAYLHHDPAARVLVSAQSNFALDNLATAVLQALGQMSPDGRPNESLEQDEADWVMALRVTTGGKRAGDRVDPVVAPWQRFPAAERLARQMLRRSQAPDEVGPPMREVLERWRNYLSGRGELVTAELADRLARGANLVFATCSASTPENVSPTASAEFDWVVVEEAAKAWPTEVIMPLLRGRRWTLIGDHFQLPAHRRADLRRFLRDCAADPHESMQHITSARVELFERAFDLFGSLFEQKHDGMIGTGPPLHTLTTQFRMREPLGELVSRVFYPASSAPQGTLPKGRVASYYTGKTRDGIPPLQLTEPQALRGSLVWLDTAGVSACMDEPHWSNAGEVGVVIKLVETLNPQPVPNERGYGKNPLAVLTPYREQARLLRASSTTAPYVSTVHAFQGREADLVVVSLVRDSAHGRGQERTRSGLGHLSQRELVNVLFSRARRMLVIVGNYEHFSTIEGEHGDLWNRICPAVETFGNRLSVLDVFGDVPAFGPRRFSGNDAVGPLV